MWWLSVIKNGKDKGFNMAKVSVLIVMLGCLLLSASHSNASERTPDIFRVCAVEGDQYGEQLLAVMQDHNIEADVVYVPTLIDAIRQTISPHETCDGIIVMSDTLTVWEQKQFTVLSELDTLPYLMYCTPGVNDLHDVVRYNVPIFLGGGLVNEETTTARILEIIGEKNSYTRLVKSHDLPTNTQSFCWAQYWYGGVGVTPRYSVIISDQRLEMVDLYDTDIGIMPGLGGNPMYGVFENGSANSITTNVVLLVNNSWLANNQNIATMITDAISD